MNTLRKIVQDIIKNFLKNEQLSFAWIVWESIKKGLISISKSIIFNLVDKNLNYFDYLLLSSFLSWHEKKLNIFRGIREGKLLSLQFLWKKAQKRHKCGVKVTKCPENPFVEADLKLNNWETCPQFLPWLRIKYKLEKVFRPWARATILQGMR